MERLKKYSSNKLTGLMSLLWIQKMQKRTKRNETTFFYSLPDHLCINFIFRVSKLSITLPKPLKIHIKICSSFFSHEGTINSNKVNKIETSKIIKLENTIFSKDLKRMLPFSGHNQQVRSIVYFQANNSRSAFL
jgi:hypothetical protein